MTFVDKRARYNIKGLVIVRPVELDRGGGILYLHLRSSSIISDVVLREMNTSTI